MSGRDRRNSGRDPYYPAPLDLTEEERRELWERQRRKFVWRPGDIVILPRREKKPKGEGGGSPG